MGDVLVVGSGLTGATIARLLVDAGRDVTVLERRDHVGGNVHDHMHPSGVRVHTYGPHYFRTNNERIWAFVNRFATWWPYHAVVGTLVNGQVQRWPPTHTQVGTERPPFTGTPLNFEEACLAKMPERIYRDYIAGYTAKQWGTDPRLLSAELAGRFDIAPDHDPRLKHHRHQGIPHDGYHQFMHNMLDGIHVELGCDTWRNIGHRTLVFTGPIDEFFGFDLGRLGYRAQHRTHIHLDAQQHQEYGQVNNPGPGAHIRTLEWAHMHPATPRIGTVVTTETPYTPTDPDRYEYPYPNPANAALYRRYRERANQLHDTIICGRLGEYRYYDMDQAIGRAMRIATRLLQHSHATT